MNFEDIKKSIREFPPYKSFSTIKEVLIWLLIFNGFLYFLHFDAFSILVPVLIVIIIFLLYSFRNPVRVVFSDEESVYSPSDGKITAISEFDDNIFFNQKRIKLTIKTSLLDVHVCRIPFSGQVSYLKYIPGNYKSLWNLNTLGETEQLISVFKTFSGHEILFKQTAGIFENRIIHNLEEGEFYKQGDISGIVKIFGSSLDILLPYDSQIKSKVGDIVRANKSVIARLK